MNEHVVDQELVFNEINIDELTKELKTINVAKSSGLENISAKVLKDCLLGMKHHFLFILNLSIRNCTFPEEWKYAKITPIPKVNNPRNVSDLRPISLLPATGKILEKIYSPANIKFLGRK